MFVAFAVDRALGFLLIVVITRAWAPAAVGHWTQVVALTGALGTIASMGLYQAHIRFAEESAEPRIRHSLQLTILSVTTGALLLAAIVAAVIPGPFSRTVFGVATETRLLAAVFALAMSELWAEFVTVQLRAEVDARGAALVMGGKAVLRVLLISTLAFSGGGDVARAVFALALAQWLAAVFALAMSELWAEFVTVQLRAEVDARGAALVLGGKAVLRVLLIGSLALTGGGDVARAVFALALAQWLAAVAMIVARLGGAHWLAAGFAPARTLFARALKMAIPMIPAAFAAQGFVTTERLVLARTSPEVIAHFTIGQQFASNAMMAYVILGSMFYPMLVRVWREGKAAAAAPVVSGALLTYAVVSLPALLVLPLVSRELVPLLTTPFYEVSASSFLLLMLGAAGLGVHQLAGYVFYVTERTWELLALLAGSLAVKLVCSVLLVARLGERGAVLSWAIAGALLAVATLLRARSLVRFTLPIGRTLRIAGAAILAGGIVATARFASPDPSRLFVLSTAALALGLYAVLMRGELRRAFQVGAPV